MNGEPRELIDAIVAAVESGEEQSRLRPMAERLKPWLLAIDTKRRFQVETVTMPRDTFLDSLNDETLLEHVTLKAWEQITDDMRVHHARRLLEAWVEEEIDYLAVEPLMATTGRSAVIAFVCSSRGPPKILEVLGAWRDVDGFWREHLKKNIDSEFPPSEDEILRLWDHRAL
jgi:hypothetical protein